MSLRANKHVDGEPLSSGSSPHRFSPTLQNSSASEVLLSASSMEKNRNSEVLEVRVAQRLVRCPVPASTTQALTAELAGKHIFAGASCVMPDGVPFIMMKVTSSAGFNICRGKGKIFAVWHFGTTPYGKVFRLSLSSSPTVTISHAFLPAAAKLHDAFIKTGKLVFAICHAGHVSPAYMVDFSDEPNRLAALRGKETGTVETIDFLFEDVDLAYWWLMALPDTDWNRRIVNRPQDTLQVDWVKWTTVRVRRFAAWLSDARPNLAGHPMPSYCADQAFSDNYPYFYRLLQAVSPSASIGTLLQLAGQSLQSADAAQDMLFATVAARQAGSDPAVDTAVMAMRLAWYVNPLVHAGRRRPWFDRFAERITPRFIDLDSAVLGHRANNYWRDLDLSWPIDHGMLLTETDLPTDIAAHVPMLYQLPLAAETTANTSALVQSLLAEAREHKQWTVPMAARVHLGIAAFPYACLYEVTPYYWCVLRDAHSRYLVAMVDVEAGRVDIPTSLVADQAHAVHEEKALGALKLILACVIRDFVVTDKRELVFGQSTSKGKAASIQGTNGSVRTVAYTYLPRVGLQGAGDFARTRATFGAFKPRSRHQVSGHLRRCDNPSPEQRLLALKDGIVLPHGCTYVRPHARGDKEREQTQREYRSRSASNILFGIGKNGTQRPAEWFDFESTAVRFTTQAKKLTIINTCALLPGRHCAHPGLDICAFDQRTGDGWLIRFMKLPADAIVEPEIISEVVESLLHHPWAARAMIVATSGYTADAVVIAKENNVTLIDGSQFSSMTRAE